MRSEISRDDFQTALGLLDRMRALRRRLGGEGSLGGLDRALGHCRGHLRRQLNGEIRPSAEELLAICGLLGTNAEELFGAVRRGHVPLDLWLGEQALQEIWQRKLLRPDEAEAPPTDLPTALGQLDERLRLGLPGATERGPYLHALSALERTPGDEAEALCYRTWDLLGASFRAGATYAAAAHCFRQALQLSPGRPLRRARILRRACYLAADQCEFEQALYFAEQAQEIYAAEVRPADLGKAWIDAGTVNYKCDQYAKAIELLEAGLQNVSEDSHYGCTAQQCLGLCHIHRKDLHKARENRRRAQALLRGPKIGPRFLAALHWLSAEIAFAESDLFSARLLYEKVHELQKRASNPLQVAVVAIRLAKTSLLLGDFEYLECLVTRTSALMVPLKRHPFARAVLTEFHRLYLAQKLNTKTLDHLFIELSRKGRMTR